MHDNILDAANNFTIYHILFNFRACEHLEEKNVYFTNRRIGLLCTPYNKH